MTFETSAIHQADRNESKSTLQRKIRLGNEVTVSKRNSESDGHIEFKRSAQLVKRSHAESLSTGLRPRQPDSSLYSAFRKEPTFASNGNGHWISSNHASFFNHER